MNKSDTPINTREMVIQEVAVDAVTPYENNPRKIPQEAIDRVAASIKEFGFKQPIVVDKDMVIIVGHTRLLAAKKLGYETVPVLVASDLSPEKARAYRLADNKTNELTDWDFDTLQEELESFLSVEDFNMEDFGFDMSFLDKSADDVEEDDFEPETEYEKARENCTVKVGDIYQLGDHRLMCGDSTILEDVKKLIDGEKVDLVFTDPPYGYSYKSNHQHKYEILENDDKILDYISCIYDFLEDNTPIYSFCGFQSLSEWLNYFKTTDLKLKNIIVWKKNNWSMGDLKGSYAGQYEIILYLNKGRCELLGKRDTDVWEFDRQPPTLHPTMKPLELIQFAFKHSSRKGDTVLDVFGGSGSTLIACEKTDRKCLMMEYDPIYCQVIINRWEALTGRIARKIC